MGSPSRSASAARLSTSTTAASPGGRRSPRAARAATCTGSQDRSTAPTTTASTVPAAKARMPMSSAWVPDSSSADTVKPKAPASSCRLMRLAGMLGMVPTTPAAGRGPTKASLPDAAQAADSPRVSAQVSSRQRAPYRLISGSQPMPMTTPVRAGSAGA